MQEALSGVWSRHQLFVATHTALHCIFVAANPESPQPFLDVSLPNKMYTWCNNGMPLCMQLEMVMCQMLDTQLQVRSGP